MTPRAEHDVWPAELHDPPVPGELHQLPGPACSETVCVECGNDLAAEGHWWCTECLDNDGAPPPSW